jgi:glycosyltransferase involved in cell wall biosynthesis
MKLLWITWKDKWHPQAGGAELVCYEVVQRLIRDGHDVTLLTCGYPGASHDEMVEGMRVIRVGTSRYTHGLQALTYYIRHLRNTHDVVVEEVNGGAPYFAVFFGRQAKRFLLYHQLARVNWLYEIPHPFSYVGYYFMVPLATRLISMTGVPVITVSESSRQVLVEHGIAAEKTHVIPEGLEIEPVASLDEVEKFSRPTMLIFGGMRAMKRTLDQVKAFEHAKKMLPDLRLKIAGSNGGKYGRKVMDYIKASRHARDIEYLGKVSRDEKVRLMRQAHVITVASVEEGWGLIVTEANSQGTPAVVYNVAGLRDSVQHEKTGLVTEERPEALAGGVVKLLKDKTRYNTLRRNAWQWSKTMTFENCYREMKAIMESEV